MVQNSFEISLPSSAQGSCMITGVMPRGYFVYPRNLSWIFETTNLCIIRKTWGIITTVFWEEERLTSDIAHYDVIILNMKFRVRKTEFQIASDMKLIFLRGKLDEK